jgi:hypothetical protein
MHQVDSRGRLFVAPDTSDQRVRRYGSVHVYKQSREHASLTGVTDVDEPATRASLERAQE